MINKDFFLALSALEKEKRIEQQQFIDALETGLSVAYKKENGKQKPVTVSLNPQRSEIKIYAYQTVVEEVVDEDKEISLQDAKAIKNSYKVGDLVKEDLSPKLFSRIAAQTAKQVIIQKNNEIQKELIKDEMNNKEGEIVKGIVRRVENDTVYLEMAGTQLEGVMLPSEQIRGEKYNVNDVINVYVKSVRTNQRGATQVMVSRASNGFVKKLFEMEVPEIKANLVNIKRIVREAGYRTKMAVYAEDSSIDAVGSCIGQKGMRINSVVQELNGEKIDIIGYSQDMGEYISRALSPAKVIAVMLNPEEKSAKAIVEDDKLSLAIGKSGQNVRLAAKLTEWKIDVKPYSSLAGSDINEISE
ncbi:MAG: transcription termination factor NusA [Clostridia bacterium]|nr:transcription termination factor NusA [Clostridia bacterium]MDE6471497.1 transcription termination factor NusA [Clostridia bacterium]